VAADRSLRLGCDGAAARVAGVAVAADRSPRLGCDGAAARAVEVVAPAGGAGRSPRFGCEDGSGALGAPAGVAPATPGRWVDAPVAREEAVGVALGDGRSTICGADGARGLGPTGADAAGEVAPFVGLVVAEIAAGGGAPPAAVERAAAGFAGVSGALVASSGSGCSAAPALGATGGALGDSAAVGLVGCVLAGFPGPRAPAWLITLTVPDLREKRQR
jgi:hypothetical protein